MLLRTPSVRSRGQPVTRRASETSVRHPLAIRVADVDRKVDLTLTGKPHILDPAMDYDLTKRVLEALHRNGVAYKVFGAVALNLHGLARATEDLDIFIAPDAANIDKLRAALHAVFADPCIDEITAADLLGEYPAVQYAPPDEGFHIDIVTRLGERFDYASLAAETVDFDGVPVTIVTARTLYEMKKATVRAKDRGDAEALARRFKLEEQ